jgi:hypothetical protein
MPAYELATSCDPCAMCLGATLWSGVRHVRCGATRDDAMLLRFDEGPVFASSWAYLRPARHRRAPRPPARRGRWPVFDLYREPRRARSTTAVRQPGAPRRCGGTSASRSGAGGLALGIAHRSVSGRPARGRDLDVVDLAGREEEPCGHVAHPRGGMVAPSLATTRHVAVESPSRARAP